MWSALIKHFYLGIFNDSNYEYVAKIRKIKMVSTNCYLFCHIPKNRDLVGGSKMFFVVRSHWISVSRVHPKKDLCSGLQGIDSIYFFIRNPNFKPPGPSHLFLCDFGSGKCTRNNFFAHKKLYSYRGARFTILSFVL